MCRRGILVALAAAARAHPAVAAVAVTHREHDVKRRAFRDVTTPGVFHRNALGVRCQVEDRLREGLIRAVAEHFANTGRVPGGAADEIVFEQAVSAALDGTFEARTDFAQFGLRLALVMNVDQLPGKVGDPTERVALHGAAAAEPAPLPRGRLQPQLHIVGRTRADVLRERGADRVGIFGPGFVVEGRRRHPPLLARVAQQLLIGLRAPDLVGAEVVLPVALKTGA